VSIVLIFVSGMLSAQQAPDDGQYAPPAPSGDQQSYPAPAQPDQQPAYAPAAPLSAQDIEQLVAPIALYPDALVAQILTASTYPAQVADADRWRRAQGNASPDQIAAGADAQPWDPSVKALTAFPQVLAQMDQNLHWTTDLGNAYYNQPQDVLQAVQVMRQRARAAGNLQSTPQETVTYDQGNIAVAPVNPQVIYVPVYNPWVVYGQPIAPYPGFSLLGALGSFLGSSLGPFVGASAVRFGLGIAMTAFLHAPWGWLGWGLNWLAQSVLFHQSSYYSHSTTVTDWGLPHGGPRAFSRGGFANGWNRPNRAPGSYERPGTGYRGVRSQSYAESRTPYTGNRPVENYNRSYQTARGGDPRTSAYRSQPYGSQRYNSSDYGARAYSRSAPNFTPNFAPNFAHNYGSGAKAGYGSSSRAYRPQGNFQRGDFGHASSRSFSSKSFSKSSGKPPRSGGFHLFGGGHAPKSSGGGKGFSRAHSSGGGHFGGHSHSGGKHRG
jgi:hypothetical protein